MKLLSHPAAALSIVLALGAGCAALIGLATPTPSAAAAASGDSPYYGRWTVEGPERFSAKGKVYRTIDVAPCGKDFCGVSVSDTGTCGATLFRFLRSHATGTNRLEGHANWGAQRKNVVIEHFTDDTFPGKRGLDLKLGEGYNFSERDGNMPKFAANYRRTGAARCSAR